MICRGSVVLADKVTLKVGIKADSLGALVATLLPVVYLSVSTSTGSNVIPGRQFAINLLLLPAVNCPQ